MALNLSNLTKYVDQVSGKLTRQIILEGVTPSYVSVMPAVKYSEAINLLSNTIYLQSGTSGWNASGTTTLDQRNIQVDPIKVNQSFDLYGPNSIEQYWAGQLMKAGSGTDGGTLPFEEVFTGLLVDQTQARVEELIWRGNYNPTGAYSGDSAAAATGDLLNATGFLAIVDAASASTVNITYSGTPTVGNVIAIVDAIVAGLPTDILSQEDIIIFCSPATVQLYKLAIRNSNAYNYFVQDAGTTNTLTQPVPAFGNVKLVGTRGLATSGRMICSYASNFYIGTDLVSEIDPAVFKLFYAVEADQLRYVSRLKVGTQIAFPIHVVRY